MEYQRLRSITFDSDTEIYTYDVAESNSDEVEICVSRNKVEALSVPAGTFALSIRAVHSLLHLPILVGTYAQGFGAGNHARFVRDYLSMQGLDDMAEKMDSVEHRIRKRVLGKEEELEEELEGLRWGFANIPYATVNRLDLEPAVRSLLSFATIAAWTALAMDIWAQAVNLRVGPLAKNALNVEGSEATREETKSIKAVWLAKTALICVTTWEHC
jgi:hypothetical protein